MLQSKLPPNSGVVSSDNSARPAEAVTTKLLPLYTFSALPVVSYQRSPSSKLEDGAEDATRYISEKLFILLILGATVFMLLPVSVVRESVILPKSSL